jgi:hypothetical protein
VIFFNFDLLKNLGKLLELQRKNVAELFAIMVNIIWPLKAHLNLEI